MRYVSNLIPASSKVLPDYFQGSIYIPAKKNALTATLMWLLGTVFSMFALFYFTHPLLFLLFGTLAFILIPPGHRFIERKLRFRLTPAIKAIAASALFIGSLPLSGHYNAIDRREALLKKQLEEKTAKEKAIAEEKEQRRKDSLAFYLQQSNRLAKIHKPDQAYKQLEYARAFAYTREDNYQVEQEKVIIRSVKVFDLIKTGKYRIALPEIQDLLSISPGNRDLLYNSALCKSKTGKIQEAVNDIKELVEAGDSNAIQLHNKINPIRKRVAFYVTRCCDGSTSGATGRGACSHHGGVCNWNDPVYEEYRKYK